MKNKIIALILVMLLCVGLFAGCASTETPSVPDETVDPEATAPSEPVTYTTFDYQSAYASNAPDAVVLTVDGKEISWKEYYGWLYSIMEQYEMYLGTEFAWTDPYSETHTLEEYAMFYAETMCAQYSVVEAEAANAGIELTDEEKQAIEDTLLVDAQNYTGGDVEAFIKYLEDTYMDEDYYRFVQSCAIYYQRLFEEYFGANGEKLSDEEVYDFINTNGFLYAKHILFLTLDDAGAPLDDATKAEKKALAEDTLKQLKAITDRDELLAKFDELMNSLSEDTGLATNPNGYYFMPGEMVIEFENGTKALEDYAVSEIVETSYGYHIILRLPIEADDEYAAGISFRLLAAQYAFDTMMAENFQDVEIVYSEEFADFNLADIMKTVEVTQ